MVSESPAGNPVANIGRSVDRACSLVILRHGFELISVLLFVRASHGSFAVVISVNCVSNKELCEYLLLWSESC
jgi:hypothetical protein